MKLYAGTTEQFMADAHMHRIAEKLRNEYIAVVGHKPSGNEFNSWQNSLSALALLIDQAELEDHGVILEYQLGNTSKRLDAMLTGRSASDAENAVVVELKQWGETQPSTAEGCVETYVGGGIKRVLHPSVQVGGYEQWLLDNHEVFYAEHPVGLAAVSYLHNMQFNRNSELWAPRHQEAIEANPLFTGDQSDELAEFLNDRLSGGDGLPSWRRSSGRGTSRRRSCSTTPPRDRRQNRVRPAGRAARRVQSVLAAGTRGLTHDSKPVVPDQGRAGTGKSVIALHLVGRTREPGLQRAARDRQQGVHREHPQHRRPPRRRAVRATSTGSARCRATRSTC